MAKTVHHGGKVGAAGKTLASNSRPFQVLCKQKKLI